MATILSSRRKTKLSSRGGLGGDVPAPGFFAGQGASLQPGDPRDIFEAVAKYQGLEKERPVLSLAQLKGRRGPTKTPALAELDRKREALRQSISGGFRLDSIRGLGGVDSRGRTRLGGGLGGGRTRLG